MNDNTKPTKEQMLRLIGNLSLKAEFYGRNVQRQHEGSADSRDVDWALVELNSATKALRDNIALLYPADTWTV